MDVQDLRVFEAVARHGGMKRAAEELATVQSNVTARIRALEQDLEVRLFDRHSRGVILTAAGERLLPYAHRAAVLMTDARRAARDDGTPSGALVVGSLETTAALHLSRPLAAYVAAHREVDLVLRTGTTAELIERVLKGELQGSFVCGPVAHPELEVQTVYHEELVLVAPPGLGAIEALSARREVRIVVLRAGCSYRQRLEEILARRGIVGLRTLEFGTIEAIVGSVAAGLGVTLMPRGIVAAAEAEGRVELHRLPPEDGLVETLFIRRRDGHASSALTALVATAAGPAQAVAAE